MAKELAEALVQDQVHQFSSFNSNAFNLKIIQQVHKQPELIDTLVKCLRKAYQSLLNQHDFQIAVFSQKHHFNLIQTDLERMVYSMSITNKDYEE